ncbi:MAG: hypothetical protein OXC19_12475 [Bryobacterales bacterium]|nr:hypothetical protein [Bryobacterales bacterium]
MMARAALTRRNVLGALAHSIVLPRFQWAAAGPVPDARHIDNGHQIYSVTYADQPYIVGLDDGTWLCCATVGSGREGQQGQHVVTFRSRDRGRTWSEPVAVEPPDGPEASYAVMLKVPRGRVYIFYNHNTDNIRQVKADRSAYPDGWCRRVDSLGYFVFKYSDDGGESWSRDRHTIAVREFDIDRNNAYQGQIRFFWNVGKAFVHAGSGYVPLTKVGGFGEGFFTSNEGVLLRSDNILTETDPKRIRWETLPEGDIGLRTPPGGGPVAGEQSYTVLSDGSLYCVYRSIDGHPVYTYSRDAGRSWDPPSYKRFADGRLMKHPRAANFAWRASNGKYLYWFHNHGGRFIREHPDRPTMAYRDRNPAWLCGGVERDSPDGKVITWTQPEIALYHDDPYTRMSYPDFVEVSGKYYISETEKAIARIHEIEPELLVGLWNQFDSTSRATSGTILELPSPAEGMPTDTAMPRLPALRVRDGHRSRPSRAGFTVEVWFRLRQVRADQTLLSTRRDGGRGWALAVTDRGTIELSLNDGRSENRWDCDPGTIQPGVLHHLCAIVDGGPHILSFVVDGKLADGGQHRQFGWGRLSPDFYDANGTPTLRIAPDLSGSIKKLAIYERALRTSEAVGNFRAGI